MFKILIISLSLALCFYVATSDIPENQEYGPILRPSNPTSARDILGYDKFQTRQSKTKNTVQYGNNWEKYDTPSSTAQDFRYNQQQPQQDYRYNNNNNRGYQSQNSGNYRPYDYDRRYQQRSYDQY